MSEMKDLDMEPIEKVIREEFPHDPALQQVHIARKLIAKEAEARGLSFLGYVRLLGKQINKAQ